MDLVVVRLGRKSRRLKVIIEETKRQTFGGDDSPGLKVKNFSVEVVEERSSTITVNRPRKTPKSVEGVVEV